MEQKWYLQPNRPPLTHSKPSIPVNKYGLLDSTIKVWKCIAQWFDEHGYPPRFDDIMNSGDLSSISLVHLHVAKLSERGLAKCIGAKGQTILLIERPE